MKKTDILIIGTGCAGLYCALSMPKDREIIMITKSDIEESDSFLAQGGICMMQGEADYHSFFEDTMRAGHYENNKKSVDIMLRSSVDIIRDLISYGVAFDREADGSLSCTREGAHSRKRILFHRDITGREITSKLLEQVEQRQNISILTHARMLDLVCAASQTCAGSQTCVGAVVEMRDCSIEVLRADTTILAAGGIGGLYAHSTNQRTLTGDALAVALKHHITLEDIDYIQIHPTTLYGNETRSFLISESVRGEGAKLYDKNGCRFVDELSARDVLTAAIYRQMEKDKTEFVWEDLRTIPEEELHAHFPNIIEHCLKMGYDVTRECIPVVPAQHYFMGGIKVDENSKTSMDRLYAIGEAACNGVHGKNRLASNSLLESLVFAKRAAKSVTLQKPLQKRLLMAAVKLQDYEDTKALEQMYRKQVKTAIRQAENRREKEECLIRQRCD